MSSKADVSAPGTLVSRLVDLVVGTHPTLRARVVYGLQPMVIYLAWCMVHAYSVHAGYMSLAVAKLMIAHNVIGIVAFYPWVRSGYTARFQDSGLIQPQIVWAAGAAVLGYYLNPPFRAAILQVLCFIHLFGLFTLRPRQLVFIGGVTITMLLVMLAFMLHASGPGFHAGQEVFKVVFACFIIALITWMSVVHSMARGRLSARKQELASAVTLVNELVTRDPLTGLFNRKHMQELLERERVRQLRTGQPFCVALIDLDHFKRINDEHGHQVGDEVLCSFAKAAVGTLRETDVMARWGGEEFLVLMPDTTIEPDASVAINRLSKLLTYLTPVPSVPSLRFTFSAGIAAHDGQHDVDQTVARADHALYRAKAAGRHCTVLAEDHALPPGWVGPGRAA